MAFVSALPYIELVNYRSYTESDFSPLYAIEEICFQPPHRFSRAYMHELVGRTNSATWISEDEERMAGFAIVDWESERGQRIAYIQTIEVLPDLRGRSVGRELLARLEQSAIAAGAAAIWLHVDEENRAAIHLYQAAGYLCQGRQEHYYGRGKAALILAKSFAAEAGKSTA
jgi:[ribosomal protein S18]-alanine N-acetyltransferase